MKPTNIVSVYQGINAIVNANIPIDKKLKETLKLSEHEAKTLAKFCNILRSHNNNVDIFDGYYVGYSIEQISKEFDLLRFSDDLVINIELKNQLEESTKLQKINTQMKQNYYYLKFLNREVQIYTFIENDSLYRYNVENDQSHIIDINELITNLEKQLVDLNINPDSLFVPSNYLISPFNSTDKFVKCEYFLTDSQQAIKKEIIASIYSNKHEVFCISANAGTGKTLLMYDIANTIMKGTNSPLIIHCGKLNDGQIRLINSYKWNICSISNIRDALIDTLLNRNISMILVDESQRISEHQLDMIINKSRELKIPIVFSYDKKQYLKDGETRDIFEYIKTKYSDIPLCKKTLTNKIRTNKEIASFITNLRNIGKSNTFLNYENVSIEYFDKLEDVQTYIKYLVRDKEWKAITYTNSKYSHEPLDNLASICSKNAHDVIGQEFDKVVFVMDNNFRYNENGRLTARKNFYSALGMLYQIVTRVVNQLKILVLNNPELYYQLLQIKALDNS